MSIAFIGFLIFTLCGIISEGGKAVKSLPHRAGKRKYLKYLNINPINSINS